MRWKDDLPVAFVAFQALLKFLEVMSAFDWDTYCVSISGRIPLDTFPDFKGE